jgi:tetratricopeptide (TPR) repeat protein
LKNLFWVSLALLAAACASSPEAEDLAVDFYNLGNAYFDQGDYAKAGEMYTRALNLDPSLAKGEYNWSRALIETGEYDQALAILDELLTQDPQNLILLRAKAYALYLQGEVEPAIETYQGILEIDPGDANSAYNLGIILEDQERLSEAVRWMEAYRQLGDEAKVLDKLGRLYAQLGDQPNAREIWLLMDEKGAAGYDEYFGLGDLSVQEEDWGLAVDYFEKAFPKAGDRREELAQLLFDTGVIYIREIINLEKAQEMFGRALSTGFSDGQQVASLLQDNELLLEEELLNFFKEKGYDPNSGAFLEDEPAPSSEEGA